MPLNTRQKMKMKSRERDIEAKPNEAEVIAQFEHLQQTVSLKEKSLFQRQLVQARCAKEGNTSEQDALAKTLHQRPTPRFPW